MQDSESEVPIKIIDIWEFSWLGWGWVYLDLVGLTKQKHLHFFFFLLGHLRNGFPLRHKDFRTTINPKTVWEGDFFVKALCPDLDVAKANSGWDEKHPKMSKAVPEKCGKSKQKLRYKVIKPQAKSHSYSAFRFGCSFFSPTHPNTSWLRRCFGLYFGGPNTFPAGV